MIFYSLPTTPKRVGNKDEIGDIYIYYERFYKDKNRDEADRNGARLVSL